MRKTLPFTLHDEIRKWTQTGATHDPPKRGACGPTPKMGSRRVHLAPHPIGPQIGLGPNKPKWGIWTCQDPDPRGAIWEGPKWTKTEHEKETE